MIGNRYILVAALARRFDHLFCGVASVAPSRMHVQIAANILELNDVG